jgi:hypothetical protein
MAEPGCDSGLGVPPAKRRDVDPIAPTEHPWNLPAWFQLPQCSNDSPTAVVIPREANLPIDTETRRLVARVSQAVVGVASVDGNNSMGSKFDLLRVPDSCTLLNLLKLPPFLKKKKSTFWAL